MIFWRRLSTPRFSGEKISLGGKKYVLPPAPLGVANLFNKLAQGVQTTEAATAFAVLLFASLQRNYPKVTTEDVSPFIDMANVGELMSAIIRVNHLEPQTGKPTAANP